MAGRRRGPRTRADWAPRRFGQSVPKAVQGGIRAQSRRGAFGESWWARRWVAVLEGFDIGPRLNRGKRYARGGQVTSIDVERGTVTATVQGSRAIPYQVRIAVRTLSEVEWARVAGALSAEAIHAAKLLSGEMPPDIEPVFAEAGVTLFPARSADLETSCSCPDWSIPCKHVAAVYYLLGEEFDRDPFLIFTLRGMTRDELLELLEMPAGNATPAPDVPMPGTHVPEPLSAEASVFWEGRGPMGDHGPADDVGDVRAPAAGAALMQRLGAFPFWRGREPLHDALEPAYSRATRRAFDLLLGGSGEDREDAASGFPESSGRDR